jgi:hypothetical protein
MCTEDLEEALSSVEVYQEDEDRGGISLIDQLGNIVQRKNLRGKVKMVDGMKQEEPLSDEEDQN